MRLPSPILALMQISSCCWPASNTCKKHSAVFIALVPIEMQNCNTSDMATTNLKKHVREVA